MFKNIQVVNNLGTAVASSVTRNIPVVHKLKTTHARSTHCLGNKRPFLSVNKDWITVISKPKNFLVHACEQLSAQVGNSILSTCECQPQLDLQLSFCHPSLRYGELA